MRRFSLEVVLAFSVLSRCDAILYRALFFLAKQAKRLNQRTKGLLGKVEFTATIEGVAALEHK